MQYAQLFGPAWRESSATPVPGQNRRVLGDRLGEDDPVTVDRLQAELGQTPGLVGQFGHDFPPCPADVLIEAAKYPRPECERTTRGRPARLPASRRDILLSIRRTVSRQRKAQPSARIASSSNPNTRM